LLLKNSKNRSWRIAGLELCGKWVRTQIVPRAHFVGIQGSIDYELKVGR
jgi:hypothetical protein